MIAESVHRVLSEERYMSDEDIASQYKDMKIVDFVLEPAKHFDGWTGRFEVEYPMADGIDFDTSVVNNFIVYDLDGNRIAWDNWMPDVATNYLESIIRKEIAKRKNGMTESKLNEIGDTERGQYMLGRLDRRNTFDKDLNPDGKHATYHDDAYWRARENGVATADFTKGYNDERKGDRRHIKHEYDMHAMNDRDKLREKFINFFSGNDRMLQLISEYETEGKDAFDEVMNAFEEKLGYVLTNKSRQACKKAYNMWWYYNGQYIIGGMEESKARQIAVGKMASCIMESVKRKLNEMGGYSQSEEVSTDINGKVFDALYEKYGDNETMEDYLTVLSKIPMNIRAIIVDRSEPEVGYRGYEIKNVDGVENIKRAIIANGFPEEITKAFCDAVDGVVENLECKDFH